MEHPALVIALIGALGIGAQWVAWRTGWPAIALMLVAGVVAGPVTGLIDPKHVPPALQHLQIVPSTWLHQLL